MTHTFKVGDKGKTRDGWPYEVTGIGKHHILATDDHDIERPYSLDGTFAAIPNGLDLLPPKQRLTGFLNVYGDKSIGRHFHNTRQEADNMAKGDTRIACIQIDIEYEEGEGL